MDKVGNAWAAAETRPGRRRGPTCVGRPTGLDCNTSARGASSPRKGPCPPPTEDRAVRNFFQPDTSGLQASNERSFAWIRCHCRPVPAWRSTRNAQKISSPPPTRRPGAPFAHGQPTGWPHSRTYAASPSPHSFKAVSIARFLLDADAEVDALANSYGGGRGQTTMNLLVSSAHPAQARLQCPLIDVLLDFGAAINGLDDDGSPIITALVFGYGAAAETLARRGARADNILVAAALGRQDLVKRFVVDAVTLAPDARLVDTRWLRVPRDPQAHIELALVWAIKYTRMRVAEFLIQAGVDPAAKDNDQMTALHWAAATGMMDLIKVLLERGAPLEVKNRWGGTVLASTAYFAIYQPVQGVDYPAVLEALLDAGADVSAAAWAADDERIADVLRRHGARP